MLHVLMTESAMWAAALASPRSPLSGGSPSAWFPYVCGTSAVARCRASRVATPWGLWRRHRREARRALGDAEIDSSHTLCEMTSLICVRHSSQIGVEEASKVLQASLNEANDSADEEDIGIRERPTKDSREDTN